MKDLPQKARSPILATMYQHDTDRGLWELLSVTYSSIRNRHAQHDVSLDDFLTIAVRVVPIVPADQYFAHHGWERHGSILKRVHASKQEIPKSTNVSCASLIQHCVRSGLIDTPSVQPSGKPGGSPACYSWQPNLPSVSPTKNSPGQTFTPREDNAGLSVLPEYLDHAGFVAASSAVSVTQRLCSSHAQRAETPGISAIHIDTITYGIDKSNIVWWDAQEEQSTEARFGCATSECDHPHYSKLESIGQIGDGLDPAIFLSNDFWVSAGLQDTF